MRASGRSVALTVDGGHGGAEGHALADMADGARDTRNISEQRNAFASVTRDAYRNSYGNDKQRVDLVAKDSFEVRWWRWRYDGGGCANLGWRQRREFYTIRTRARWWCRWAALGTLCRLSEQQGQGAAAAAAAARAAWRCH
jgi:hypothetical protein